MNRVGMAVGPYTLAAPVEVPEPGDWYVARALDGERPTWVRVRADGEDERAIEGAWDRVRYLDNAIAPRPLCMDKSAEALAVSAPAGVSLERLLAHRHEPSMVLTPATVLAVGVLLAELVVGAHERGKPHGHLSPRQIWLSPAGELTVWGYGAGPDGPVEPAWCAPERARGRRASGDADQWGVAAVLASLVTGRVPWRGEEPMAEAREGDASHLWTPVMEQWKPLGRLLERALASEPRDRFPSAHPMRQALQALAQRVRQEDDLARIGALLWERYPIMALPGLGVVQETAPAVPTPGAADAEDVPATMAPLPRVAPISPAPMYVESADDVPTVGAETSMDETVVGWMAHDSDLGPPVVRPLEVAGPPTSPTAVPAYDGGSSTSWEDVSPRSEADEPPSFDRVALEEPPSYRDIDITRVAPWVVGGMVLTLLLYVLAGLP